MAVKKITAMVFQKLKKKKFGVEISPDEIFLDDVNLPAFDKSQFEGRIERPLGAGSALALGVFFTFIVVLFGARLWQIQIAEGKQYAERSRDNTLKTTPLFAERGRLLDRNGEPLAWNVPDVAHSEFLARRYAPRSGSAHTIGFLKYPSKDSSGFYVRDDFKGVAGAESVYNEALAGENGVRTLELDVRGTVVSESVVNLPRKGNDLQLSIDARLNEILYGLLMERMRAVGFEGGAAALMDVSNGEVIALTSAPEYAPQILSDGAPASRIASFVNDTKKPFLDRATAGLYAPGSIVKPLLAAAALEEKVISPEQKILSTGSISIPNPYDPKRTSVFNDWKAHGWVDMRQALAVSSDVYFYEIGGGFENQKGLGIARMEKYLRLFGMGEMLADPLLGGAIGTIPGPDWKKIEFPDDQWRIGDTYNTSIGQYGMLVTPLQMLRAVSAVANGGRLLQPTLIAGEKADEQSVPVLEKNLRVVREGMRLAVTEGTASGLYFPFLSVAAKTGTAEVGIAKKRVHSWVVGFFPYEAPRYAFVVLLEKGPRENTVGGVYVMKQFFEWLFLNAPEYLK
ncbi:MAG: Penicillin-binding protein 2 [Parcubacteria group bacterium Gr01-1014_17]|nr:MAG: Penicillin-binding protein 2 [Parcubacteria group bacterium Gr01-1014_17]